MHERLQRFIREGRIVGNTDHLRNVPEMESSMPEAMNEHYAQNPIHAEGLFYAGTRTEDRYAFMGYKRPDSVGPMIWAGCREFSIDEARRHWGRPAVMDTVSSIESLAFVNAIEAHFANPVAQKAAIEISTYDKAYVQEFLGDKLHLMFRNWVSFQKGRENVESKRVVVSK